MNNENFQEMLSDGRILEIALQYCAAGRDNQKKGRERRKYRPVIYRSYWWIWTRGRVQGSC